MTKTLLLVFHPNMAKSRANKSLIEAAKTIDDIEIVDFYSQCPFFKMDNEFEANRLLGVDRIIIQFPIQWYNVPSLLKEWIDQVFTRMFYIFFENEGAKMKNKPVLFVATAGNLPSAYKRDGQNFFSIDEIFAPLFALLYRCEMKKAEPFLLYEANKLNDHQISSAQEEYKSRLIEFIKSGS